ncbi:MAG: 3-phosphoshikimate 1-carboxyvinyltransferase [Clostridia bacterium]|nr:3-phosphoshikimate 1-carboxyvinyltransferase [Clostridia bacterium]
MTLTFTPTPLSGVAAAPPSKSMAHRYLLAAALARGTSRIAGVAGSEDILATVDCLSALGARATWEGDTVTVTGIDPCRALPKAPLPCRESGSTLRFFLPLCWLSGHPATLSGSTRLFERPLSVYHEIAAREGLTLTVDGNTVTVCGRLAGGDYPVRGDISSQFITGLLSALPFTGRDSTVRLLPPVESRSYLDLTVAALGRFGLPVRFSDDNTLLIPAQDALVATDCRVEGDHSNAAFLAALALLGHDVRVTGLDPDSAQGDRIFRKYFLALQRGMPTLSLADCPDLAPILMAVAAALHGGHFVHTRRLKLKESDRGAAMAEELAKFGVRVTLGVDEITVHPSALRPPCEVLCGHNDHRIVMAVATLCTLVGGSIAGCEAVRKSFPDYFDVIKALGAKFTVNP